MLGERKLPAVRPEFLNNFVDKGSSVLRKSAISRYEPTQDDGFESRAS